MKRLDIRVYGVSHAGAIVCKQQDLFNIEIFLTLRLAYFGQYVRDSMHKNGNTDTDFEK